MLDPLIAAFLGEMSQEEALAYFAKADVTVGPVLDIEDTIKVVVKHVLTRGRSSAPGRTGKRSHSHDLSQQRDLEPPAPAKFKFEGTSTVPICMEATVTRNAGFFRLQICLLW